MEEEEGFIPYKDISELKKELEGIKDKKDVSTRELYEAVSTLAQAMEDMLEVFGAASEQLKLEEKGYEAESKKHEAILGRLDKLLEQNRTIAEGMVAMVEMVKEKFPEKEKAAMFEPKEDEEPLFKKPQPSKQEWRPRPAAQQRPAQTMAPMPNPSMPTMETSPQPIPAFSQPQPMMPPLTSEPDLDTMPPMQPEPLPDLDFPEDFPLDEEPKKKGIFGMFKR